MTRLILDCSSMETTVDSLCRLFRLSQRAFENIVKAREVDWHHPTVSGEEQIVRFFLEGRANLPMPDAIRWFHATRAPRHETFAEGLLPTNLALPKLWDSLGAVASSWSSESEWADYRESFNRGGRHFADQFHDKGISRGWEGPFAFLVKDAALGRHDAHKNFTRMSEALEDICSDYEEVFSRPLAEAYQAATAPCLVIFTRPGSWPRTVETALNYVYRELRGLGHGLDSNTNFTGRGNAVPPEWIDMVEWL